MKKTYIALTVVVVLSVLLPVASASASDGGEVLITFPNSVVGVSQHGNLLVVVHFRKDDKNRLIDLVWESPDGEYGRSSAEIDSRNDGVPIAKDLVLSTGAYTFTATLYRSDGSKTSASKTRLVTSR